MEDMIGQIVAKIKWTSFL